MIREKERFMENPRNYAMYKSRLAKERDIAAAEGNQEEADRLTTRLAELEERAEHLDRARSEKISSIALINDRNRKRNIEKAEENIKQEIEKKKIEGELLSLEGKANQRWLPNGGWRSSWPKDLPSVGFQDPAWKGLPWAPVGPQLAKRPMWIIEATPKDKYYLYGKVQLYVDKETYQGAFNRKFSWQGDLMNTYYVLGMINRPNTRPDGQEDWIWASNMGYQTAENVKMNRATVSGLMVDSKDPASDRRLMFDPAFFDFNALQRFGK